MAARPYSSSAFGNKTAAAVEAGYPSTCSASARPSNMSLAVSLERFDCLSTSSSSRGLGLDDGEAASSPSCFELPLELILGCDDGEESDLPVCAAFLFDSDGVRKSVLKRRLEAGAGMEPRRPSLGKVPAVSRRLFRQDLDPSRPGLLEVEVSSGIHIAVEVPGVEDKHGAVLCINRCSA